MYYDPVTRFYFPSKQHAEVAQHKALNGMKRNDFGTRNRDKVNKRMTAIEEFDSRLEEYCNDGMGYGDVGEKMELGIDLNAIERELRMEETVDEKSVKKINKKPKYKTKTVSSPYKHPPYVIPKQHKTGKFSPKNAKRTGK